MTNTNQEPEYHTNNILGVLAGMAVGGLAGAVTMLLLAPQSGKETRMQIQEKGIELRDRTAGIVDDVVAQARSNMSKFTYDGREKIKELKQHGQEIAAKQLDRVSEAAKAGKKAIEKP